MTNSAFVTRVLYTVKLDGVTIGQRMSNALGVPTQAPTCVNVPVAINQDLDDQTPENDNLDLGLALTEQGDLLAPAGSVITVRVQPITPFAAWWNFFHSAADYPSGVTFQFSQGPSLDAPAATVVYEDLTAPGGSHAFENATSDTHVLNFTNEWTNVTASFGWNAINGSVVAQLNGPEGLVFEDTFEGEGSYADAFEAVPSGAWNLTLVYSNFTGSFDFALDETAPDDGSGGDGTGGAGGDGGTGGAPGSGDGDGNATGNGTLDDAADKGSPGLPMLVGLGAVALVAALRRRR